MKLHIKLIISIIFILVAIVAVVIVLDTNNQQPQLQNNTNTFSSSVKTSLPNSIVTLPSTTQSVVTSPFNSTAPSSEPPATTPSTKPTTTKPATSTPATTAPTTKPTTSTTKPVDPNHTHDYTKEYAEGWAGGAAHYVYTCSCGHSYQEAYSCGTEGHICKSEAYHNSLMEYITEGCTHCGSSECPCLLTINASGYTWPDYTQCPQYDVHNDPSVYCQTCGLVRSGNAESGEKCCSKANKDITCTWCGKEMFAGECHQCTKP